MAKTKKNDSIKNRITELLENEYGVNSSNLKDDSKFVEDFEFDELDMVDMVMELENIYKIKIDDDDISKLFTFKDIVELVESKAEGKNVKQD